MRWKGRRQSENVQDRRGAGGKLALGGGLGGLLIALLLFFTGGDAGSILEQMPAVQGAARTPSPEEDELAQFVGVVLADTEDVWSALLGPEYRPATLVLFRDQVSSACGATGAAVGPFYCPLDENVYIDLGFYEELRSRFGAPGDFAQAYVVAHEVGHHVQNLLGTMEDVQGRRGIGGEEANRLSVQLELQADFYAGVWAHHAERMGVLDPGDIEEALGAASAVGDDRLQRRAQGYVVPESFTHGSSEQRVAAFRRGHQSGDYRAGDVIVANER